MNNINNRLDIDISFLGNNSTIDCMVLILYHNLSLLTSLSENMCKVFRASDGENKLGGS